MISVTENIALLSQQENQLHTSLDNLRGQRSKVKEHKQLEKELSGVVSKRQNLQAWAVFELKMPVHRLNSPLLGIVKQLKITPGGMGEVWVSWDGLLQIPEQPNMLQIDGAAMAKIIAVGDRIEIRNGHELSGKTFTVERLLARGAVETTEGIVFEREEWLLVEKLVQPAIDEDKDLIHSASFTQELEMVTESTEELSGRTPETIVAESFEGGFSVLKTSQETVETITIAPPAEELTEDEEKERHRLELKVERAFYESGRALTELRDRRLYRSTHQTFERYCQDRFGFSRQNANYFIAGASIVDNLKNLTTICCQILPTKESQVRPLAKLEPKAQCRAWQQAVEQAEGKVPSSRIVRGIVERLKEKPLVLASEFCKIGDPFILNRLEGAERKYNGCWAIASELRDFTVVVDVYDNTFAVKPDNLDPIDLPDVRRQLPETLLRIRRLRECDLLDRCAYTVLESLGRQIYLTEVEEGLLQWLENHYKVNA